MASPATQLFEVPKPDASLTYQTPAPGKIVVRSQEEYAAAAEHLKTIKAFQRRVTEWFAPLKKKASDTHRALCEQERKVLQPSVQDEQRIKRALVAYTDEQERKRREEQERLRQQAREREEAARLEQAAALEREAKATGNVTFQEAAEQLLEAPIPVAAIEPVTPPPPKVEGLSYRETYRAEVVDLMTLVKAVAAGQQPIGLLAANQSALDGMARSLKQSFAVPGVRLVCDKTPVTRTR